MSAPCFVPSDVPLADGRFRFRCESQCGHHGMGRLAGEPRQVPGVAQGASGVVLPAGERRLDGNVADLAGVAVVGPEYDVGVLEALQVLRRDAGGVVVGCEVVEVVVVQLFLQPAVDDAGNAANGALGRVAGVGASYGGQVRCDLANFLLEPVELGRL